MKLEFDITEVVIASLGDPDEIRLKYGDQKWIHITTQQGNGEACLHELGWRGEYAYISISAGAETRQMLDVGGHGMTVREMTEDDERTLAGDQLPSPSNGKTGPLPIAFKGSFMSADDKITKRVGTVLEADQVHVNGDLYERSALEAAAQKYSLQREIAMDTGEPIVTGKDSKSVPWTPTQKQTAWMLSEILRLRAEVADLKAK